jgi:hypothetical protein
VDAIPPLAVREVLEVLIATFPSSSITGQCNG